jgi:hypothetical protein
MRGRRPEADPRFTFHASRFDKLTVPSQAEGRFTVLGSGPRTTQMVADHSPQERSMSDRPWARGAVFLD